MNYNNNCKEDDIMLVNIYSDGFTRGLEHLGPGNHYNVDVPASVYSLAQRMGARIYPVHQDPNRSAQSIRHIPPAQQSAYRTPQEQRQPTVQQIQEYQRQQSSKLAQMRSKNSDKSQFIRPADMSNNNSDVRFNKQVSDSDNVENLNENTVRTSATQDQPEKKNKQFMSARDIDAQLRQQNADHQRMFKTDSLNEMAEKRQREIESAIHAKHPDPIDYDSFDKQYEAEKKESSVLRVGRDMTTAPIENATPEMLTEGIIENANPERVGDVLLGNSSPEEKDIKRKTNAIKDIIAQQKAEEDMLKEEESQNDIDIDALLDSILDSEPEPEIDTASIYDNAMNDAIEESKTVTYDKDELMQFTNKKLGEILKDRGYVKGKMAPKPYDRKENLVEKVLATQTTNSDEE